MDIEVVPLGPVTVVAPKGDLDMTVAEPLKRRLTELIDQGRWRVVLDLGAVAYIDSAGLGTLVAAMKRARGAGGDIKLCALQPDVRSIFAMTRLNKVMDVHPTRQAAVASWE
jgi:anti-sigma B factor antagonist